MPQITDIKPQKKNPKRFNIYVDGRFAFAVSSETLVKEGLKIEQELSEEEIQRLIKENEFQKVYDRVLNFFSYRPRSEKELSDWFVRKEIGEEIQKMVIPKIKELGLLNDEEFARWWLEQRATFRPAGKRLLKLELQRKGISGDIIVKLLDCYFERSEKQGSYIAKDSEKESAKKIAEKKLNTLKRFSGLELKQKLSAHLVRRGFDWETVKEVVDEITGKD